MQVVLHQIVRMNVLDTWRLDQTKECARVGLVPWNIFPRLYMFMSAIFE